MTAYFKEVYEDARKETTGEVDYFYIGLMTFISPFALPVYYLGAFVTKLIED